MTKILFNFLFVLLISAGLSFGGPNQPNAHEKDTLVVWTINNGVGAQGSLKTIVRGFQKETGTPVRIRVLDWGDAFEKIGEALLDTTGTVDAPDLLQLGSTWITYFASIGGIRPLNTLSHKIDFSRFLEVGLRNARIEGDSNYYAIPWFMDVRGLFVNERLWRELNINESNVDSIASFMGTLRAVGKSNLKNAAGKKVVPFALPSHEDWTGPQQMAPFVWSFGGDFIARDSLGIRSSLLDSSFLRGFAVYASLMGDSVIGPHSLKDNSSQSSDRFVNSEQLVVYGTAELIRLLEFFPSEGGLRTMPISEDGIMAIPFPGGPAGKSAFVGGSHLALSGKGDALRRAQAEKLLVYLLRADNLDAYSRKIGFLPADQGLVRIWVKDVRYIQLVNNLDQGKTFPNIAEWGVIEYVLNNLAGNVAKVHSRTSDASMRNAEIAKLLVAANRKINEILKASDLQEMPLADVVKYLSEVPGEVVPTNLNLDVSPVPHTRDHEVFVVRCLIAIAALLMLWRWRQRFKKLRRIMNRKKK